MIDLTSAQGLATAQSHAERIQNEFLAVLKDKSLSTIGRRVERANLVSSFLQAYSVALRELARGDGTPGFDVGSMIVAAFKTAVQQRFPSVLPDDVVRLSDLYADVQRMIVEANVMFHELAPLGAVEGSIREFFLSTMQACVAQLPNFASQQIAVGAAVSILHKVRDGRQPKKTLVAASNAVKLALLLIPESKRRDLFGTLVSDPYVAACASYYEKHRKHLDTKDVDHYLQQVNALLSHEEDLCMTFTGDKQTATRSKRAMQTKLLADQRQDIVRFGVAKTVEDPNRLDPAKFSLFVNLFDFDPQSVDLLHKTLATSVASAIKQVTHQVDIIDAASRVVHTYRDFVSRAVSEHSRITFLVALENGIRDGLAPVVDIDELLAYHFDSIIKRAGTDVLHELERSSRLLSAAKDDIFFEFYKQLLAVRLLARLGANHHVEKVSLTTLRSAKTVPQHYFAHIEIMLAESMTRLCNDQIWPEPIVDSMNLPAAIETQIQKVVKAENDRRLNTRVVADIALTTVEATIAFQSSEQPCVVVGTAPQMAALMTIIERKRIKHTDFASLSGISDSVAKGILATVAAANLATVGADGEYALNESFMSGQEKKKKILLPNYTRRKARR